MTSWRTWTRPRAQRRAAAEEKAARKKAAEDERRRKRERAKARQQRVVTMIADAAKQAGLKVKLVDSGVRLEIGPNDHLTIQEIARDVHRTTLVVDGSEPQKVLTADGRTEPILDLVTRFGRLRPPASAH